VAVQGFGNVGSWTARLAHEAGFKIVALGDFRGGCYNQDGIDVEAFRAWLEQGGAPGELDCAERVDPHDFVTLPCDVLIPAATGEVIHSGNVRGVRARIIVEAANHPITLSAEPVLAQAGVEVIPDILANAGGVVVSYFEWTQNIQQFRWAEERVNEELHSRMTAAYRDVRHTMARLEVTMREAAFVIALERVAQAIRLRGFV
jgi:glutamate dehydrogenase (NAD(P)+)